jgi:AcrR family transcriptional regulator
LARTPSISNDQILEAAREIFLKKGFSATTAEIAERAGISEGTIYRRFSEKFELFRAAMELPYPHWLDRLEQQVGEGELFEVLTTVTLDMIDFFEEIVPKIHMIMSSGEFEATQEMFHKDENAPPVVSLRRLTDFFERERQIGRIGPCDPEVVARMLLGTCFHFAHAQHQGLNDIYPMPRQTYARSVVRNLLFGLTDRTEPTPNEDNNE